MSKNRYFIKAFVRDVVIGQSLILADQKIVHSHGDIQWMQTLLWHNISHARRNTMQRTFRALTDQECRETLEEISQMVINTYKNPIRKGFERASRMGQAGFDLIGILRRRDIVRPGSENEQERLRV